MPVMVNVYGVSVADANSIIEMALGGKAGIRIAECVPVHIGPCIAITLQQLDFEIGIHIAPGVFDERHQIVCGRSRNGVLIVEQRAIADQATLGQPDQVVGVEVAQHDGAFIACHRGNER